MNAVHWDHISEPDGRKLVTQAPRPPKPAEGHPVHRAAPSTWSGTQRAQGRPHTTALLLHTHPVLASLDPPGLSHTHTTNEDIPRAGGWMRRKGDDKEDPRGHISNTGHTELSSRSGPVLLPPPPRRPRLPPAGDPGASGSLQMAVPVLMARAPCAETFPHPARMRGDEPQDFENSPTDKIWELEVP